jgi:hypothetical protein
MFMQVGSGSDGVLLGVKTIAEEICRPCNISTGVGQKRGILRRRLFPRLKPISSLGLFSLK